MNIYTNIIIGLLLGIILMYFLTEIKNNCWIKSSSQKQLHKIIEILVRQTARYGTASLQDENPLIALLHANYSAGYLWALKDIATTSQIKSATGIDFLNLEREITNVQDKATLKMAKICPKYVPKSGYLSKVAKESV
jgi:hypothetical protein